MLRDELVRRFPLLTKLPPDSYVVGGAIRDLLIGIEPADVDVACLDPKQCAALISDRVIRLGTGEHLSAWRVVRDGHTYDFAQILDHDVQVDLARRDFTVNAMALFLGTGELLDPHDGRGDLRRRLIRMIAPENFDDDPLRCLKGVRMALRHRCAIDRATMDAIRPRASRIGDVAAERVTFELSIIFSSGQFRRAVELLHETGLDAPLFGRSLDAAEFRADDVSASGAYALLAQNPRAYAKRWRWSADTLREVTALQQLRESHTLLQLFDAGESVSRQLQAVLAAMGRDSSVVMPDFHTRTMLTGEEIASIAGVTEGPELGRLKRALLEAQINGDVRTRTEAEKYVQSR